MKKPNLAAIKRILEKGNPDAVLSVSWNGGCKTFKGFDGEKYTTRKVTVLAEGFRGRVMTASQFSDGLMVR